MTILILFARCVDSSPVLYAMLFGKSLVSIDWLKLTLQTHKNVKVCNCTHSAAPLTPIAKELLMAVQKEREVIGVKLEKKMEFACQSFNEGIVVLKVVRCIIELGID